MDESRLNPVDEEAALSPETPEDVAVLYTWANVHGGKYRDFSASRREYRAQQRHRIVEAQRQAELEAARALEEAAARELEEARRAEATAKAQENTVGHAEAEEARRQAEEHSERERLVAQRHVETAEELRLAVEQAQREMEEARARAEEQAARYAEADKLWRESQKKREFVPGAMEDPYYFAGPLEPTAYAPGKGVRSSVPQRVSSEGRIAASYYKSREAEEYRAVPRRPDSGTYGLTPREDAERQEWRPSVAEQRIESAEDTRERNRPDEQERRDAYGTGASYEELRDDSYHDRMPLLGEPRDATGRSTRNSAQSDLHIPPRMQQTRTGQDSGAQAIADRRRSDAAAEVSARSDQDSGARATAERRRRESATDLSTRTERRPRSERFTSSDAGRVEDEERDYLVGDALSRDGRDYHARHMQETFPNRDSSPEWLLRSQSVQEDARERERLRLDEQQRLIAEHNLTAERLRVEDELRQSSELERRTASEALRAADMRMREQARAREEEIRMRAEQDRRRAEDDRARLESHRRLEEQRRRQEEDRAAEDRRRIEVRRLEDERARAEERRRATEAAEKERASRAERSAESRAAADVRSTAETLREERPLRDSQMLPAADGGVNLRPLSDRGPVLSSLPPMADRPSRTSIKAASEATAPRANPARLDEDQRQLLRDPRPASSPERVMVRPAAAAAASLRPVSPSQTLRSAESAPVSSAASVPALPPAQPIAPAVPRPSAIAPADTLQQSRERVAARWFALKGLVGQEQLPEPQAPVRSKDLPTPCLAVVSLSGGVGKTSLVATVGRALSSVGEKVLLADTTSHGLLPYYFGARELRPDVVRTFSPPPGSSDAPVYMVNYETDRLNGDEAKQQTMVEEMMRHARGAGRILLDLNGSSAWLARMLTRYHSNILVPIAADMNSVLSIQSVDRFFSGSVDSEGRPVAPYYVLNQFDASLPLHLDVREVLRQQLGNRLLPVMIRRSPSVSEALAEGMTVIDYAPESPVTEDYKNLAEWVRNLAPPATTGLRSIRWSER